MTELLDRRVLDDGQEIFHEGDMGLNAFIIQSGHVSTHKTINGKEVHMMTYGPNEIFGEMGLVDHKPRTASARSKGGCTIVTITHEIFEAKLAKSDPFIRHLLTIMAETIRETPETKSDS